MMLTGTTTKRSKKIDVYTTDGAFIGTFIGYSNAARATNTRTQNVYKVLNGYKSSLNGYNFILHDEK